MAWARRMSQWSAYYFSRLKKKKKKLRESLLLMNSIKEKLQRKRFSAKIIQHGAELKTARWPKVEGPSWFQNPDLEFRRLSFLAYLIPRVSLFFFFNWFPRSFFHLPFCPPPLSPPQKLLERPRLGICRSHFSISPLIKELNFWARQHRAKLTVKAVGPLIEGHLQDLSSNAPAFDVSGQLRLLNIRANMFIPPSLAPLPHPLTPRKVRRVWLTLKPCTLIDPSPAIPTEYCILGKFLRGAL